MVRTETPREQVRESLRRKVEAKQGEMTDVDFAALLGISRPEWHNIRTGKRKELSRWFVGRILEVFPDLTWDVMQYIKTVDPQPKEGKTNGH